MLCCAHVASGRCSLSSASFALRLLRLATCTLHYRGPLGTQTLGQRELPSAVMQVQWKVNPALGALEHSLISLA